MAIGYKPYGTFSVDAEIEAGKDLEVSESTLSFKEEIDINNTEDSIHIRYHNIITRYIDALSKYIVTVELTDDELYKYKFQPKLFCFEQYGTPELSSSLLYINNMVSATNFNKQTIKAFTTDILSIISELFSITENELDENRANLKEI